MTIQSEGASARLLDDKYYSLIKNTTDYGICSPEY
jgi:hypothetical protein